MKGDPCCAVVAEPAGWILLVGEAASWPVRGSGVDPDRLRAEGHTVMPLRDIRSVTVPGCVDGWLSLHERYGRLSLAEVLAPASHYAEFGFPASPTLAASIRGVEGVAGAEDLTRAGPPSPGTWIRRGGVGRALAAIAAHGRAGFYEGEFGEAGR